MRVSLQWLKEFVDVDLTFDELDKVVSTRSQEVESIGRLVEATGLVVGLVKTCRAHPNADKLSVCEVDVKETVLTIVCGAPNVKAGDYVIVAKNGAVLPNNFVIKKTTIRDVESNGMICSLNELGIEQKYHNETGIHVIKTDVSVGMDALKALYLDDAVMALDLTPNRSDLLSMHGVAYDLAAIRDVPLKIPEVHLTYSETKNPMTIETTTSDCLSYYGSVIDNVTIKESPLFIKARLIAAHIRPINNVVDITNYVMLETGQPLHAFDYDLLDSEQIVVRHAKPGEQFVTLDDKIRTLDPLDIVVTDGENPVALAGVMGGAKTEVHQNTKRLFLESAVFNPVHVRKTSNRLDLRSESSLRFERGVDTQKVRYALDRATALLIQYAEATVQKDVAYFDHTVQSDTPIEVSCKQVNAVLGTDFTVGHIEAILKRLRFEYTLKNDTFYVVKPTRRPDFATYQDLVEEIGRISGYEYLPNTLPTTVSLGALSELQRFRRRIRRTLEGLGLDEVMTYHLQDPKTAFDFVVNKHGKPVKIKNPMSDKRQQLRLTPINGLIDVIQYNKARQMEKVHVFELGAVHTEAAEKEVLAIAMSGVYHNHDWRDVKALNFFTLKGIFEALLKRFDIQGADYEQIELDHYHPHQTALIRLNDNVIGHIGKIHPETAKKVDLEGVYVCEVEVEALFEAQLKKPVYQAVHRYPSVSRDIAIVLDKQCEAKGVIKKIKETCGAVLSTVTIFDVYEGDQLHESKKSLGIRMVFVDPKKTLKATKVDKLVQDVIDVLKTTFDAALRE